MENAVDTEITIYGDEQEQTLLFTCPKCGCHTLVETGTDAIVDLSVKRVRIENDRNGEAHSADLEWSSGCELTDFGAYSESFYHCGGCGEELEYTDAYGDAVPVQDQSALAEWILKNCTPQD